jgi:hypothetical protein
MNQVRSTLAATIAAFALHAPLQAAAQTPAPAIPGFQEEAAKQNAIYQRRDREHLDSYVIGRTLSAYVNALPEAFGASLARLKPGDRWLDIGAGEGQAVLDYCAPAYDTAVDVPMALPGTARVVAMSIEDRRTTRWHDAERSLGTSRIRYLHGRPLGEYADEELGRFQVITDMIGGFSYTPDLFGFTKKTLAILTTGGSFFTVLQDVQAEDGSNKPFYAGEPFLTRIVDSDGADIGICAWLKRIECAKVTCQLRPRWKPPIEIYHIEKTCDDVRIPELVPVHYKAGTPPERRFRLKDLPSPAGAGTPR